MSGKMVWIGLVCLFVALLGPTYVSGQEYLAQMRELPALYSTRQEEIEAVCAKENLYLIKSEAVLDEYCAAGLVEHVEPNQKAQLFGGQKYTACPNQWGLDAVQVQGMWRLGCYGAGTRIAVIDSGIYPHPDLASKVAPGHNYTDGSDDTNDVLRHGTLVAGVIAASGSAFQTTGAAPEAVLVPLKCFDSSRYGDLDDIIRAIYDAVDVYDCKVLNMSFGVGQRSAFLDRAVAYALSEGAVAVAAVGNEGNADLQYPAACDGVVGVGAVDRTKTASAFSQKNESVFVTAPGEGIFTATNSGSAYAYGQGTSFSAPFVSALAALAYGMEEAMTQDEFREVLQNTCEDLGESGYDTAYGYGLINAKNMVNYLLRGTDCYVSQPDFAQDGSARVIVYNNREQPVTLCSVWADYKGNGTALAGIKKTELILQGKSEAAVCYAGAYTKLKHFLWHDMSGMQPAFGCRVVE